MAQNVNAIGSKSDTPKPLHRKEKRSYFEEELLCFDAISEVNKKLRAACERDDSLWGPGTHCKGNYQHTADNIDARAEV